MTNITDITLKDNTLLTQLSDDGITGCVICMDEKDEPVIHSSKLTTCTCKYNVHKNCFLEFVLHKYLGVGQDDIEENITFDAISDIEISCLGCGTTCKTLQERQFQLYQKQTRLVMMVSKALCFIIIFVILYVLLSH